MKVKPLRPLGYPTQRLPAVSSVRHAIRSATSLAYQNSPILKRLVLQIAIVASFLSHWIAVIVATVVAVTAAVAVVTVVAVVDIDFSECNIYFKLQRKWGYHHISSIFQMDVLRSRIFQSGK